MEHHRGQWGSNIGFLMATVGAAVGLGNIWGFPYKMGASGRFPFLIIYIALAVLVGFPIMLTELAIGRKSGKSVLVSYQNVAGGMGTFLGFLAIISPLLILSFYTVLGAYCIQYVCLNFAELIGVFSLSSISGCTVFYRYASVTSPWPSVLLCSSSLSVTSSSAAASKMVLKSSTKSVCLPWRLCCSSSSFGL